MAAVEARRGDRDNEGLRRRPPWPPPSRRHGARSVRRQLHANPGEGVGDGGRWRRRGVSVGRSAVAMFLAAACTCVPPLPLRRPVVVVRACVRAQPRRLPLDTAAGRASPDVTDAAAAAARRARARAFWPYFIHLCGGTNAPAARHANQFTRPSSRLSPEPDAGGGGGPHAALTTAVRCSLGGFLPDVFVSVVVVSPSRQNALVRPVAETEFTVLHTFEFEKSSLKTAGCYRNP